MGNGALSDFKSSIIAEDTSAGKIGPTAAFVVQSLLVLHSRLSHSLVDGPRSPVKVSIFQPSANLVSPRLTENRGAAKGKGGKKREEEGENENGKRDRTGRVESDEAIPRTSRQLARGNTCVNFAPFLRFDIYRTSLMYKLGKCQDGDSGKILYLHRNTFVNFALFIHTIFDVRSINQERVEMEILEKFYEISKLL